MKLYEHYRSAFPALVAQLENARHHRRLSHAFLVQADTDRSRREFAMVLAQIAACPESRGGRPCLECRVCRELEAGSYPELYTLSPVGKMYQIKVGDRNDPDPNTLRSFEEQFHLTSTGGANRKVGVIYDADRIVHCHHTDVREVHFHRQVDKAVKPFGMSYARIETRSTYHQNLGPRAANFTARAIFESPFVQSKFAFASFLNVGPHGVIGVDADNDLYAVNDRATFIGCQLYGKVMTLFGKIDECIAVLDFPCPVPYVFSAGVIYANFVGANTDLYDMEGTPLPPYTWYTEAFYKRDGKPILADIPPLNPAIKMCVHNYAWTGYPSAFFSDHIPTVVVGQEQADLFDMEPMNIEYMSHAVVAKTTEGAMDFAYKTTGTDKVIIFDGAMGGLNCSESLADLLIAKAPEVSKEVDEVLMPKWFRQRGVDVSILKSLGQK